MMHAKLSKFILALSTVSLLDIGATTNVEEEKKSAVQTEQSLT